MLFQRLLGSLVLMGGGGHLRLLRWIPWKLEFMQGGEKRETSLSSMMRTCGCKLQCGSDNMLRSKYDHMTILCQASDELLSSSNLPPYLPRSTCLRTATKWLHRLGYRPQSHCVGGRKGWCWGSSKRIPQHAKWVVWCTLTSISCKQWKSLQPLHQMRKQEIIRII